MEKQVIITGGAGFIGSHLVDRLLDEGKRHVTVLDNFHANYPKAVKENNLARHVGNPLFSIVEGDILDEEVLDRIFSGSEGKAVTVVHLAALVGVRPSLDNPTDYHRVNVTGTLKLLEKARMARISHFILASSSSVYGDLKEVPWKESATDLKPISPYAASKIAAEEFTRVYARLHGLNATVLRFFTVYGPRQRPDLAIHSFFRKIDQGLPIQQFGDGGTQRDYTHVDDIVTGMRGAMDRHLQGPDEQGAFDIFNLGNSRTVALRDLIGSIERQLGRKALLEVLPEQAGDVRETHADVEKARAGFGYSPVTELADGLADFQRWLTASDLERSAD
ncbi:MAG: SDR family NAD(P)-dependent oxidoreductase [Flavobacteriales bacterium]|nr:SDR family NAD(P)-dependent oxidoreductase [Flavobacteriales bacterium]